MRKLGLVWCGLAAVLLPACAPSSSDSGPAAVKEAAENHSVVKAESEDDADRAAYLSKVELREIKVTPSRVALEPGARALPAADLTGEVKNAGDRSLDVVEITVYFLDRHARPIYEGTARPVHVMSQGGTPLRANYSRPFNTRFLFLPEAWAGNVEVKVTDVKFSTQGGFRQ